MDQGYIHQISLSEVIFSSTKSLLKEIDLFTVHPVFQNQLNYAKNRLEGHFKSKATTRPLNCLVLGSPGSGKSYLVQTLKNAIPYLKENKGFYEEHNLSQCGSVSDIKNIFSALDAKCVADNSPGIVFFDEFDVRIAGTSAIQALISPIYDNKNFKNLAFIFSGSYLKNRRMLGSQLDTALEFDMRLFMSVLRFDTENEDDKRGLREIDEIVWRLETRALRDPDENVLEYLASLEKLTDFRSRINGFIIEIPDLASPLDVISDRFCISSKGDPKQRLTPNPQWESYLLEFVRTLENHEPFSNTFTDIDEAVIKLQDTILLERFWRTIIQLKASTKRQPYPLTKVRIRRSLLNYLTVVPLRHGMRSLEYLISLLELVDNEFRLPSEHKDMLHHHIQELDVFRSPEVVWRQMSQTNTSLNNTDGQSIVELICN